MKKDGHFVLTVISCLKMLIKFKGDFCKMLEKGFFKDLLARFAAAEDAVAFSTYDGKVITDVAYPQFHKDILLRAGYFRHNHIEGQNIALMCPGDYDFFVAFFAIVISGNAAVILNPDLPDDILKWQCEKADVTSVFTSQAKIRSLRDTFGEMTWVDYRNVPVSDPMPWEDVEEEDPDRTVLMMFTSGTTGKSKVVEMSSGNLNATADSAACMYDVPGLDVALHAIPRYHIGAFRSAIVCFDHLETIFVGRGIRYLFMDIPAFNPKCVIVVPAMLEALMKLLKSAGSPEEYKKYLGTRLERFCVGGAALRPNTAKFFMDLGISIGVTYGMTETTCIATWCILDEKHIKTIGKPFGGMDCRIEDGEILIKGPAVMKGYYKDPEETAKIMDGQWIHSGDMGYVDEDGYFYLMGRKKNVIILANGENVNPEEVEDAVGNSEAILECLVYGDGKGICADVYTLDPETAARDIKAYNRSTPTYRQIYKVNYSDTPLEKTGSGKLKRKENVYEQK